MRPNDKTAFARHDERVGGTRAVLLATADDGDLALIVILTTFTVPFDRC